MIPSICKTSRLPLNSLLLALLATMMLAATGKADMAGWSIRTEQSGTLRLGTTDWQQQEHLSTGTYAAQGTYTTENLGNGILQLTALVEGDPESVHAWRFSFKTPTSGSYTLDYSLFSFAIHEEGRFYRSSEHMGYAQWLDAVGAQDEPRRVWEYLTGQKEIPSATLSWKGSRLEITAPPVRTLAMGQIGIEGSLDLKTWFPLVNPITIDPQPASRQFFRLRATAAAAPLLRAEEARTIGQAVLAPNTPATLTGFTTIRSLVITLGPTAATYARFPATATA